MRPAAAFLFFLLFLAGFALVNLRSIQPEADSPVLEPSLLIGPIWQSTHLGEMRMDADTEAFIQFAADGNVSGNAGCNGFFATWELSAGVLEIGQIGVTKMACPEPASSLEFAFLEIIGTVHSAARNGSKLVLKDQAGQSVMRFSSDERTL